MKRNAACLIGVHGIGLPDTQRDHTNKAPSPAREKKTAAPAGPRNGGYIGCHEATGKPRRKECRKTLLLTSVSRVASFTDEGHLFGWEVAR